MRRSILAFVLLMLVFPAGAQTVIGVTPAGVVALAGDNPRAVPSAWNGMALTVVTLTAQQQAAYRAAAAATCCGLTFDGVNFAAIPAPAAAPTTMQIASASAPALNGAYAIDPASQQKVQAISLYIAVNGKFPAGQAALPWPDASGALHQFQSTAQWQAFATAMGDFVAALDLGQTPAQPATIP